MYDQDYDPFGRGPKGHLPISTQPPPLHPHSSIDETSFRPTSECSQPMFPDASFDVSTNKSTATSSHHRPLRSAHIPPPPLPPNTPSMYRSNPPPMPASVHRHDKLSDSHVPPSPMQIVMSRHSASTSHSREAREPHYEDYYPDPKIRQRDEDREDREPPPSNGSRHYNDEYDQHYHHERYHGDHHKICDYGSNREDNRDQRVAHHLPHQYNSYQSFETQHRCNCESCRRKLHHDESQYYMRDGHSRPSYHQQDVNDKRHLQIMDNSFHNDGQRSGFSNADNQRQHARHSDRLDGRRDYAHEQLNAYRKEGQYGTSYEKMDQSHHYGYSMHGSERLSPPPESPLSPITFDERRHGWSPKSDNATLHADTFQVPHYVAGASSHERKEYARHNDYDNRYRGEPLYNGEAYINPRGTSFDQARSEMRQFGNNNDRADGHIPTHVSYQSHDSRQEHHRSNTSPDRRDDYSGSTIPTYSTVTPTRASNSPHLNHARHEARPNLRVDIPISPNVLPNNTQPLAYHQHQPPTGQPNTSRSSGYYSVPTSNNYNHPPNSTRSYPTNQSQRTQGRVAVAEREREKSEVRHQLLKEIHQATDMRNSALDENDRKFWDRQIATLNESFKHL